MFHSKCCAIIDERGYEQVRHGTAAFPIACYHDDLSRDQVPWHWHDELEVALITEGCAIVAAGKEKFTIRAGEGFFINAGVLHGAWAADTSNCRFHSLVFHPRLVGGSLDSVFYQSYLLPILREGALKGLHFQPENEAHRVMLEKIESAWQSCVNEPPGYELKVRNDLSELVFLLGRGLSAVPQTSSGKALRDGERIKAMLAYIHENFSNELDTKQIARSALISESECLRCFRATIGTTPIQYVRQYRIQRAAQLLTNTREKISDIAAQCGFQDISYFTKTFRESKGCVPSQYRREAGK